MKTNLTRLILILTALSNTALAAGHRLALDCQSAGTDAGLESLLVVQGPKHTTATVEVSGAGDFIETFTYRVQPIRDAAGKVVGLAGPNFKMSFAAGSGAALRARFTAIAPAHSQMYPGATISYGLPCTR